MAGVNPTDFSGLCNEKFTVPLPSIYDRRLRATCALWDSAGQLCSVAAQPVAAELQFGYTIRLWPFTLTSYSRTPSPG